MKQLRESIHFLEDSLKRANGRDAYIIKKTIIDLRKEQYILKDAYSDYPQTKIGLIFRYFDVEEDFG